MTLWADVREALEALSIPLVGVHDDAAPPWVTAEWDGFELDGDTARDVVTVTVAIGWEQDTQRQSEDGRTDVLAVLNAIRGLGELDVSPVAIDDEDAGGLITWSCRLVGRGTL